ncbi:MAG: substrate-binding domain-containing protein [Clostridia bacterium]|nr:substrate-binding domain-containing protein [Clostridia bacterium]
MKRTDTSKTIILLIKIFLTIGIAIGSYVTGLLGLVYALMSPNVSGVVLSVAAILFLPSLVPFVWMKRRKKYLIGWSSSLLAVAIIFAIPYGIEKYEESITINVTPSINVREYLPFEEESKIVKLKSETLRLTGDLPIIDGATAAFPVYSAFVHAVYPETTRLYDGVFEYNNTLGGYEKLAEKKTDIFLGAAPSKEQIAYATQCNTVFQYTQIGTEAFVFFVHKDNPIESLTVEQIKGIYSGRITNWSEVGGNDEEIVAFQRNEGSGSQSMLIRFMGDTPIMPPETKKINGMGEIIEQVVDYQSKTNSIGFSFRYYVEGIIKNPDIKMIAVDGAAPTVQNVKNGSYPITTPVYAVTYENNPNPNVSMLISWILSEEGQYIIEQTGYVGIEK